VPSVLNWGIDVVLWFQQFSPALDLPFKALTALGEQEFFMLMLPLVYWCIDREAGSRLIFLFLISVYLNQIAKAVFNQPRPFEYDPRVRQLTHATGGGLPSGHTQGAVVVWGFLAIYWKRPWLWVPATALMIGIPLSRIYLGVHFPTDLLGGFFFGAVLLWLYFGPTAPGIEMAGKLSLNFQLLLAVGLPLVLATAFGGSSGYGVMLGGVLMGLAPGLVLERRFLRFKAGGRWRIRLSAYLLGVAMLFGFYFGLRLLFGGLEPAALWRLIRYAIVGFWGAFGAPWLFVKLKLVPVERHDRQ
jgi:membrane-associated phospholipid phosphatase